MHSRQAGEAESGGFVEVIGACFQRGVYMACLWIWLFFSERAFVSILSTFFPLHTIPSWATKTCPGGQLDTKFSKLGIGSSGEGIARFPLV